MLTDFVQATMTQRKSPTTWFLRKNFRHTFACLATGAVTIFGSSNIAHFVQGGVVKIFRCQAQLID